MRTCSLAILAALLSGPACAGELLHMPFACHFDGARVVLLPSADRTYEVIGHREREIHTACAPADPSRCRSWFMHRFDLDCAGARVSWLEVAEAAAREGGRDVWIDDGRFSMRMGRFWSVARAPGEVLERRRWRSEGPFSDALDDFGPGIGGRGPARRIVTLPPGFAPALGVPIAFSGDGGVARESATQEPFAPPQEPFAPQQEAEAAPQEAAPDTGAPVQDFAQRQSQETSPQPPAWPAADAQAPAATATSIAAPAPQPIPELPHRAPPREARRATPPPVETAALSVPADKVGPKPAAKVAAAEPVPHAGQDVAAADGPVAANVPGPIKPVIINAPRSAAEAPVAPVTSQDQEQPEIVPPPDAATPSSAGSMQTAASDLADAAEPSHSAPERQDAGGIELGPATMATSAMVLILALLAGFAFWRWSRAPRVPAPPADRDIARVSFDGAPRSDTGARQPEGDHMTPADRKLAALKAKRDAAKNADDLPVPTTYEQALAALGVRTDATVEAIKKVVDGLRRSWHPDHATSDADRAYRERRLRQVNVAWDLVSAKRSTA